MAIRRHVLAVRNTEPAALAAALGASKVSDVEAVNGWCWVMASVWTTGSDELLKALETLDGPGLLVTSEDGCRWRLHLRKAGLGPVDTAHEFHLISMNAHQEGVDDWNDLVEEEPVVRMVELPGFPPLPEQRLAPLDIEDDFFEPYGDDADDEEEDEEDSRAERTPLEQLADSFEDIDAPLPTAIIESLASVADDELTARFLVLHAEYIAGELARFGVPHDHDEVVRILTGESVTPAELDGDVGNLWRFLAHLGLGPKFEEAIRELDAPQAPAAPPEDPALRIIRTTGKIPLIPIEGGPVPIALEETLLLARITYYQDPLPQFALCVRFEEPPSWPAERAPSWATLAPVTRGLGYNLTVDSLNALMVPRARRRLGALLAGLPDGARLELLGQGRLAKTRVAGTVKDGQWWIESASSPLRAEDLAWILPLLRAAEACAEQHARDEAEVEVVLAGAARHMALYNAPPHREGLLLRGVGRSESEALAALLFRHRLASSWEFSRIEKRNAQQYGDWIKFEAQLARENALPATDVVVYAGEASRFLEANFKARSIDQAMREKLKARGEVDKAMALLDFAHLGAVVCEAVGGGILRCYAHAGERTWSVSYLLPYGMAWHDYTTRFEDGTVLTTGNGLMEGSLRDLRLLECARPGLGIAELHEVHREGVARLEARGFVPAAIEPTLEGICRAMDEFLSRRLGQR